MVQFIEYFLIVSVLISMSIMLLETSASALENHRRSEKPRLMYNIDYDALSGGFFGTSSPDNIDKCVDHLASAGVTDLFVCVNNQRVNYRSKVWDAMWDGYDPNAGDDQPFFADLDASEAGTREQCRNFYNLYKQGCDYPQRFLARTRKAKVSGWISIRMNDCHFGDRPNNPYHSEFWRKHPEWYLRDGGCTGTELDYAQPEVREHYLALIREICEGYNLDGLELDFMRFPAYFHPNQWRLGDEIMTDFVREVRSTTQRASKRLKHPVKLGVRVHFLPWTSKRMGTNAVKWAEEKLVDLIVVAPWYTGIQSDMPIETWRGLLSGTKAQLAYCLEDGIDSGAGGRHLPSVEEAAGVSLAALHRGADFIYLFNWYNTSQQSNYIPFMKASRTYDALNKSARRHPVTTTDPFTAEGERSLPFTLPTKAPRAVFPINIGPKPDAKQKTYVEILTDTDAAPTRVMLNNIECKPSGGEGKRRIYECPENAADEGINLVTIESDGTFALNWVEIGIR